MMGTRGIIVSVSILTLALGWPTAAHAYIDPGSASIGLQALIALGAAGALALRRYARSIGGGIGSLLGRRARGEASTDAATPAATRDDVGE
jgi:hypothetical protein